MGSKMTSQVKERIYNYQSLWRKFELNKCEAALLQTGKGRSEKEKIGRQLILDYLTLAPYKFIR